MIEPCKNSGTQEFSMSTSSNNLNVLSELSGAQCRTTKCDMRRFPVDTGRKLNVHKTFRRRPGRLRNVLCTFNLRPMSTGLLEGGVFSDFSINGAPLTVSWALVFFLKYYLQKTLSIYQSSNLKKHVTVPYWIYIESK